MHHDIARAQPILDRYPCDESSLVMVLQDIQSEFRYLPCEVLEQVARHLGVPKSRVFSVATFYKAFSPKPQGRTVIRICKGTACHVRGAQLLQDEICRQLGVPVNGTTEDLAFTVKTVNCVGACALAPVVITGEDYHPEVKPSRIKRLLKALRQADEQRAEQAEQAAPTPQPAVERLPSPEALTVAGATATEHRRALKGHIRVCGGPGCLAAGARGVFAALERAAAQAELPVTLSLSGSCEHAAETPHHHYLKLTGCQGLCQQGPLVHLLPDDTLYHQVKPKHAAAIVGALKAGGVVAELLDEHRTRSEHPFYRGQQLQALGTCGQVDPDSLDDYLAHGGFTALGRALSGLTPAEVLRWVDEAGLRGRGGAGFATARKWRTALKASEKAGVPPYVLCNGDEGDPGAFMDRAIMEGTPFAVLEGMILGAFALGAREGYIYVRDEYPLAVTRLQHAIDCCRAKGLLGEAILGTGLSFDVRISRGGGAFVCGESTALMRSLEGKVGEPRAKYVRSAERGLYERPTVLNNVETWALVPGIVAHGPSWLSRIGTERSKGTKAFSLVGQVARTGLVEVPMGTTLRQLIFENGGGMRQGGTFKAVQTGGPSGGCLPASRLDLPIDFEALDAAGSMMGSGGMIVMDERTCMVDVARYFVDFLLEESCGKCAPCRLGLPQLSYLLGKVTRGEATAADLTAIETVAGGMATCSLCGLGKSAPNPVLSTLRYFRAEYEAHLDGRCPAGVCRQLIRYEITEDCTGCLLCLEPCPQQAISGRKKERHVIDQARCDRCGICLAICTKYQAVRVTTGGAP